MHSANYNEMKYHKKDDLVMKAGQSSPRSNHDGSDVELIEALEAEIDNLNQKFVRELSQSHYIKIVAIY